MRSITRPRTRQPAGLLQMQRKGNSTQAPQEISPHVGFYKTFGRPVAKVLLMATFIYQVAYWGWVKLEKNEIKTQRTAEIKELEGDLQRLMEGNASGKRTQP